MVWPSLWRVRSKIYHHTWSCQLCLQWIFLIKKYIMNQIFSLFYCISNETITWYPMTLHTSYVLCTSIGSSFMAILLLLITPFFPVTFGSFFICFCCLCFKLQTSRNNSCSVKYEKSIFAHLTSESSFLCLILSMGLLFPWWL